MHRNLGSISRLPLLVSATSCADPCFDVYLPLSHLPLSLTNFLRSSGFNIYMFPRFSQHLLCIHLVSISKFPHPVPLSSFRHSYVGPKTSPCVSVSQKKNACIFMYLNLHLVSMSRLHPSCLNNLLRSSCFNIELSLPPMCLSISCIHFASYVDFPPLASPPLLTFLLFQYPNFPCINNFLHGSCLSNYLYSPDPVPGPKKHVQVQKKKAPRSKNIQPNVSAYNNGVSPLTLWKQGPRHASHTHLTLQV